MATRIMVWSASETKQRVNTRNKLLWGSVKLPLPHHTQDVACFDGAKHSAVVMVRGQIVRQNIDGIFWHSDGRAHTIGAAIPVVPDSLKAVF